MGSKLLVTVLFSRTQPLIRYEMSDRVAAAVGPKPSDMPYDVLARIEGREEEVLRLAGVSVHPNVFHGALERVRVSGWQVIEEPEGIRVLLAGAHDVRPEAVEAAVSAALARVGVIGVPIMVELVVAIPRTALVKAPLIRRSRPVLAGALTH